MSRDRVTCNILLQAEKNLWKFILFSVTHFPYLLHAIPYILFFSSAQLIPMTFILN